MKEKEEDDFQMNKHLEYLHDLLIKPIARHLCQMKREHKLILAPMEVNCHASHFEVQNIIAKIITLNESNFSFQDRTRTSMFH